MGRWVFRILPAAIVALLAVLPARLPAFGDDLASIRSAMKTASAGIHSFRIELTSSLGMNSVITIIREPIAVHMQTTGMLAIETYVTDGTMYMRIGTAPWRKQTMPSTAASLDMVRTMTNSSRMTVGPDIVEDGVGYGSLIVQTDAGAIPGLPIPDLKLTCTYDKVKFLMHDCKAELFNTPFTETFVGYDDPANVVVLPADAANAVEGPPVVFPEASPAPTASPK
jgi:hypothetical protein